MFGLRCSKISIVYMPWFNSITTAKSNHYYKAQLLSASCKNPLPFAYRPQSYQRDKIFEMNKTMYLLPIFSYRYQIKQSLAHQHSICTLRVKKKLHFAFLDEICHIVICAFLINHTIWQNFNSQFQSLNHSNMQPLPSVIRHEPFIATFILSILGICSNVILNIFRTVCSSNTACPLVNRYIDCLNGSNHFCCSDSPGSGPALCGIWKDCINTNTQCPQVNRFLDCQIGSTHFCCSNSPGYGPTSCGFLKDCINTNTQCDGLSVGLYVSIGITALLLVMMVVIVYRYHQKIQEIAMQAAYQNLQYNQQHSGTNQVIQQKI